MDVSTLAAILLALVAVWAAFLVIFWVLRPKDVSIRELLGLIPDILRLLRSLIGDRTAPLDVRLVLIGLVAWIVSPIDLIPEFIPVLGPMDDVVVAIVAMRYVRRRVGTDDLHARQGSVRLEKLTANCAGPRIPVQIVREADDRTGLNLCVGIQQVNILRPVAARHQPVNGLIVGPAEAAVDRQGQEIDPIAKFRPCNQTCQFIRRIVARPAIDNEHSQIPKFAVLREKSGQARLRQPRCAIVDDDDGHALVDSLRPCCGAIGSRGKRSVAHALALPGERSASNHKLASNRRCPISGRAENRPDISLWIARELGQ